MHCFSYLAVAGTVAAIPMNIFSSGSGAAHTGEMTFNIDFSSNACNLPAAGMDVAVSAAVFDSYSPVNNGLKNPNLNDLCGKMVQITFVETGVSTTARIVDRKASGSADAIDVSPAVFAALGVDSALGHAQVSWTEPGYP